MVTLFSLFDSELEATNVIDALAATDFGDQVETEIITGGRAIIGGSIVAPAADPQFQSAVPGPVVLPFGVGENTGLDDEEAAFFAQGVKSGGVLLKVDVDDEQADVVRRILREHNGRTYRKG
jgi:hypothetical protein